MVFSTTHTAMQCRQCRASSKAEFVLFITLRDTPMLGWFQALMPREERFFALFGKHAAIVVAGAEALRDLLQGGETSRLIASRFSSARPKPTM